MFTDVRVQKLKFKTYTFSGSSKVYIVFLKNSQNPSENVCVKSRKKFDTVTEVCLMTITED